MSLVVVEEGKKLLSKYTYGKAENGFYSLVMRSPKAFAQNATKSKFDANRKLAELKMDEEGFSRVIDTHNNSNVYL